jgi:thiol-disulfide isomerase/thioredoxin
MHGRRTFITGAAGLFLVRPAFAAWSLGERVALPGLTLLDGSALDLAALKGKVVVLGFWASWCPFCAKQNPLIDRLYRAQRANGLEVVAVSIDKTRKAAADYMKAKGYAFSAGMINPAYESIYRLRKGLPQTYVVGRDGRVLQYEKGEMFEEDVNALTRLL